MSLVLQRLPHTGSQQVTLTLCCAQGSSHESQVNYLVCWKGADSRSIEPFDKCTDYRQADCLAAVPGNTSSTMEAHIKICQHKTKRRKWAVDAHRLSSLMMPSAGKWSHCSFFPSVSPELSDPGDASRSGGPGDWLRPGQGSGGAPGEGPRQKALAGGLCFLDGSRDAPRRAVRPQGSHPAGLTVVGENGALLIHSRMLLFWYMWAFFYCMLHVPGGCFLLRHSALWNLGSDPCWPRDTPQNTGKATCQRDCTSIIILTSVTLYLPV